MARGSSLDFSTVKDIANLVQGVSQQAAQQRRDAQCESQFDCINSVADGCVARPPLEFLKLYPGVNLDGAFFNETSEENENYITGVGLTGVPFAYDLSDGTVCTIINSAPDYSYLSGGSGSPRDKLRAQVVDDFTYIANRTQMVAMTSAVTAAKVNEAMFFFRATQFKTTYSVILDGVPYSHTTDATDVEGTGYILSAIRALIPTGTYFLGQTGSLLYVRRNDFAAFTAETGDGGGDEDLIAFLGSAKSYSKLPAHGFTGVKLAVTGETRTGEDDFYVQFNGTPGTGQWDETVGPSVHTTLDAATMPHALVNTNYREFTFRRLAWSTRIAGDEVTAKDPSFVGKYIRDITFYNRRLAFLHRAGIVFGKTNNPFTFFPDTLQTVLATAPIDLTVGGGRKDGPAVLDFALMVAENLFLWAQKVQFRVSSGQLAFKAENVEDLPAMAYEYSPAAYPLPVGAFLFMPTDAGSWATIRALQFANAKLNGDEDLTAHVPTYIPGGVRALTASESLRQVYIQTDGDRSSLFLLNYTYDGQQFIQDAVNTWRIPGGPILWCSIQKNVLRLIQQRPEGACLLAVNLTPSVVDGITGATYKTRLDMRVRESQVTSLSYNSTTGNTTFTLPYIPTGPALKVVLAADNADHTRGRVYPIVSQAGAVVTVAGDLSASLFYVGQQIVAERTESQFFIRGDNGAEPTDRLTLNRFKLAYAKTGYSRIEITTNNGKSFQYPEEGRVLGSQSATTGTPTLQTGSLDAPIGELAQNVSIRLVNDSFLPSSWQNAAYDITAVGWNGGK